jgi:hypothetical protein
MWLQRRHSIIFVFLACILVVDLTAALPQTYYTETDDHSYRSKPCTSSPTPETLQAVVNSATPGKILKLFCEHQRIVN